MEMQRKRRNKQKHKHKLEYTPGNTLDKKTIIKELQQLNFSMDRILRAFKVYEHNYGKYYDLNVLIEIVVRLQKKDSVKYDEKYIRCKEEEKRDTTKYLIDDNKNNEKYYKNYNNKQRNSLSLSMSSNMNLPSLCMEYAINTPSKSELKLLRRHTDQLTLHENYQYENDQKLKQKKKKKKKNHHKSNSVDIEYGKNMNRKCNKFISNMRVSEASELNVFDYIDHRDFVGKFCTATIVDIDKYNKYNLKIHYDGYPDNKYDIWCNYKTELFRFAKYRSISRRFQDINNRDNIYNKLYKENINIGSFVNINPIYTIYGGKWYKGIINKFDKKSDQIQIAYKPFCDTNDYILYWTHIENIFEIKPFYNNNNNPLQILSSYELEELPEHIQCHENEDDLPNIPNIPNVENIKSKSHKTKRRKNKSIKTRKKKKTNFSEWNTSKVIEWINKIEDGKFNDDIYDHFRKQIEIIQLKGYELTTLNETALKFAGLLNKNDRKLIINNILNLVNKTNSTRTATTTNVNDIDMDKEPEYEETLDGNETLKNMIDVELNLNMKCNNDNNQNHQENRVLNEVMDLWKDNV